MDRVIVLVDMDCFYVQVEERLQPQYQGKPCVVVQYNPWQGGGLIAVNYEARKYGIKRGMRGNEAKRICPDLHMFCVPEVRGKADLTRYREAGAEVLEVLSQFCDCVERASVDEAYLDMTAIAESKLEMDVASDKVPHTFVVGWEEQEGKSISHWLKTIHEDRNMSDKKLAVVATIVEEMRDAVFSSTKFRCSAGIAHNKMLAKLACGLHKPNCQTVIPHSSVPKLYTTIPIYKLRSLGGKLGEEIMEKLGIETLSELAACSERKLRQEFGDKTGPWLFNVARGIESEAVTSRQLPKSIGCGKNFSGKLALNSREKVRHWLLKLAEELEERLNKDQHDNNRIAKALTVHLRHQSDSGHGSFSRGCQIKSYSAAKMAHDAYNAIEKFNTTQASSPLWIPNILNLSLTAGRFQDHIDVGTLKIENYFGANAKSPNKRTKKVQGESATSSKQSLELKNEDTVATSAVSSYTSESTLPKAQMENNNAKTDIFGDSSNSADSDLSLFETKVISLSSNESKPQVPKKGFFATKLQELNNIASEAVIKNCDTIVMQSNGSLVNHCRSPDVESAKSFCNSKQVTDIKKQLDFNCAPKLDTTSASVSDINSDTVALHANKITAEIPKELKVNCKKCNQFIPVWELQEHEDYHFALNLQNSHTGQTQQQVNKLSKKTLEQERSTTKKRLCAKNNGAAKKCKGDTKTIDFFFKK